MGRKIDLTGQRFGKWKVLRESEERDKHRNILWECLCDCGHIGLIRGGPLRSGKSNKCMNCLALQKKTSLIGQRFGKLVVVSEIDNRNSDGRIMWECVCDCGTEGEYVGRYLTDGDTSSCGCLSTYEDLTSQRFNKWTVLKKSDAKPTGSRGTLWECVCDCGNKGVVRAGALKAGSSKSCGCLFYEVMKSTRGPNNWRYNPNLTDEERLYNRYQLYGVNTKKWAREIHVNYGFTCQKCNSYSKNLNAHHLNAWNTFPEQRFDTANGITLCKDCHKEFHHFNGYGDNTLEQFRDHLACTVGEEYVSEIEETLLSRESEIIGQEEVEQKETHELQTT